MPSDDDDDLDARTRRLIREVLEEERQQREKDDFYIKRKELYDTHQRTLAVFRMFDKAAEVIGKTVLLCVFGGIVVLILLGSGKVKLW